MTSKTIGDKRYALHAPMAILAAVLFVLAPALLQLDGLIYPPAGQFSDLTITHWPAFEYLRDSVNNFGAFPLWRSTILGGTPFAADPVSGLWYPPNWLSIVPPLEWFFKFVIVAHLFLGGWSMMRLARSFGVGWVGATASGIAYAIAPRALGHAGAGHVTLIEAWAWIPLVVWGARQHGSAARVGAVASGAALGMCALADLRVAAYAGIAVVLYVLVVSRPHPLPGFATPPPLLSSTLSGTQWSRRADRRGVGGAGEAESWLSRLIYLLVILLIAAWVSAAVWMPAQSLAAESTRANLSLDEAGTFSLPPEYLLGTLLASRGDPERVTYLGLTVLVMALIDVRSAWRDRRRFAVWLIGLAAIGVISALGVNTPVYALLYELPGVPLLRVPGRAWILVTFAVALACGFGVDGLMRWVTGKTLEHKWKVVGLLIGSFALLFGAGGALIAFAGGQSGAERVGQSMIGLAILLPLTIGLAIARSEMRLAPMRFGVVMLALITIDLSWVGWGHYRVISRDEAFTDGRALAESLGRQMGFYRVYSPSYSLPQHVAQAYGLELVDGIDPLQLERTVRFMQQATGLGEWGYSVTLPAFVGLKRDDELRAQLSNVVPDPTLLGALNVKFVAAHFPIAHPDLIETARVGGAIVYENARALPRAWVVGRVDAVNDQAEAIDWMSSHDLAKEAVVEGGEALNLSVDSIEARIIAHEPDRVVVSAYGPGLLVLSEVYQRDWRASIDGAPARVYPTNGVLRGVYLPKGQHRIEFVYDPVVVKVAVMMSGIGLVGLGGWVVGRHVRQK